MERPGAGVVAHLAATAAAAAELLGRLQERDGDAAWGALFEAPLPDFDAWLLLRRDALPSADRALPGAASRLLKHLDRTAPAASGKRGRGSSSSSSSATDVPAAKAARAVLRAFPARVLASQPTASLVPELLVGFEPVRRYVAALTERFGHIADFCADPAGGFPAVGVRWRPAAFVPSPLRPATAHAVVEVAPGLILPNLPQALAEMEQLGRGLVARAVAL
jgi:hypothetical protein